MALDGNVRVRLVIELLTNGTVNVTGPIQDKILCFGLLEVAKDVVREHVARVTSLVQPATRLPGEN